MSADIVEKLLILSAFYRQYFETPSGQPLMDKGAYLLGDFSCAVTLLKEAQKTLLRRINVTFPEVCTCGSKVVRHRRDALRQYVRN